MSEATAELSPGRAGWVGDHRTLYLRSGGSAGHIMDLTEVGGHALTTHCLIRHIGRRSGRTLITPLIYGAIGGEVVVVASNSGADRDPDWYGNLCARGAVDFQIATQAFRGSWREPDGHERGRVWDHMVGVFPPYADYRAATARRIPIVMLAATGPMPVFGDDEEDQ